MPDTVGYTIQVPIRTVDADDVKNAFAHMYNYQEKVDLGLGVLENNPVTKEKFVETCCAQFLFNIYKNYMIQKAEIDAKTAAETASNQRSSEVVQWFDNLRAESLPTDPYSNHPLVDNKSDLVNSNQSVTINIAGTDPDNLPLTYEIVQSPNSGEAVISQDNIVYTPDVNFGGDGFLTYKAFNGTKYSNTGEIFISVICVKPYSSILNVDTTMNVPLDITLSGTDPLGGNLTYSLGSATSGTISLSNNIVTYTPAADYTGEASFGFTVNNGVMDSDEYYIYLTIE